MAEASKRYTTLQSLTPEQQAIADEQQAAINARRAQEGQAKVEALQGKITGEGGAWDTVTDTAKGLGSGLVRGVTSLPGMPADLLALGIGGTNWASRKLSGETYEQQQARLKQSGALMPEDVLPWGGEAFNKSLGPYTGGASTFEPKTKAGRIAQGIGEVTAGAIGPGQIANGARIATRGGRLISAADDFVRQGLAPLAGSTVAGEVADAVGADPDARALAQFGGGAATGGAASYGTRPETGRAAAGRAVEEGGGPARGAARMDEAGAGAIVADSGPPMASDALALAARPGSHQSILSDSLRERSRARGDQIRAAVDDALGMKREDFAVATQRLKEERSTKADALYTEAGQVAKGADASGVAQGLYGSIASLFNPDNPAARSRVGPWVDTVKGFGDAILAAKGDYAQLHEINKAMGRIERDRNADPNLRHHLREAGAALDKELDRATTVRDPNNPNDPGRSVYQEARGVTRESHGYEEARERGQALLSKGERADQFALDIRKMSDLEKRGLVEGLHDSINQLMDDVKREPTTATNVIDREATRSKLRVLENAGAIPRGAAERLTSVAQGLERQQALMNRILANSTTAGTQEALKRTPNPNGPVVPPETKSVTLTGLGSSVGLKAADAVLGWGTRKGRQTHLNDKATAMTEGANMSTAERTQLLQDLQNEYRGQSGFRNIGTHPVSRGLIAGTEQADEDRQPLVVTVRPPRRGRQ